MAIPSLDDIRIKLESYPSMTKADILAHAERVRDILTLKEKHGVVILGHNYMEPLVFECSSKEEQGDSYALSDYAAKTDAKYIIFNGVRFMAETAKILNPKKTVLIADKRAGCSLADNFGADDVKKLKAENPGVPVMIYINSYAEAKAECDVVCTSANAMKIALKMPGDKIIFVPDILFAANLEKDLEGKKEVIYPRVKGAVCEVHEKFTLADMQNIRATFEMPKGHPTRVLYAHWECTPEVLRDADFYGSTSQIRNDIAKRVSEGRIERAFIASECELTSNLSAEFPSVRFSTACSVRCSHMARITIEKVHRILIAIDKGDSLGNYEVTLPEELIERAKKPILRMLELSKDNKTG